RADRRGVLEKMGELVSHTARHRGDPLFDDGTVSASRVHIGVLGTDPQPVESDGVLLWMDGEILSPGGYTAAARALIAAYRADAEGSFAFLREFDGTYAAVLYDVAHGRVHLFGDRHGLRHLYVTVHDGCLVWGSEVKVVLAAPRFTPVISREAVSEFVEVGYLLENRTWFEGVELIPSGTVVTWDAAGGTVSRRRYWWWDQIRPLTGRVDERAAAEELGRRFVRAVERRCGEGESLGMQLSGGLDSRAILAALPDEVVPLPAVTYGRRGSGDVRIAARAARVRGVDHQVIELNAAEWLPPRVAGMWWTDGHENLLHMHAIGINEEIRRRFGINLNGFLGDMVLGGSFMPSAAYVDAEITPELAAGKLECSPALVPDLAAYRGLGKTDFFFLQNRMRRFTYSGTKYSQVAFEHRKPFLDYELIDFAYALPDALRFRSRVYKTMLLQRFPALFHSIPWQSTGASIRHSRPVEYALRFPRRVAYRVRRDLVRLGVPLQDTTTYTDYPGWIREEPARGFFHRLLASGDALYTEFIPRERVVADLEAHQRGMDRADMLCRYLSFELWLQQVYNGAYRTGAPELEGA
ncbi:MAG: hypothetical protein ICV87_07175, partial [Gemmatimonadetes bacterium]|nr:hypothetical protein [Gemmatimonadota bacterium]